MESVFSELLLLGVVVGAMAVCVCGARSLRKVGLHGAGAWLAACIVPLLWMVVYYALVIFRYFPPDDGIALRLQVFRPAFVLLIVFFCIFIIQLTRALAFLRTDANPKPKH